MGYCPYSILGRDTAGGVAIGTSGEFMTGAYGRTVERLRVLQRA